MSFRIPAGRTLPLALALALRGGGAPRPPGARGLRPSRPPNPSWGSAPGDELASSPDWGQVLAYLRALDAASDRVSVEEVGPRRPRAGPS